MNLKQYVFNFIMIGLSLLLLNRNVLAEEKSTLSADPSAVTAPPLPPAAGTTAVPAQAPFTTFKNYPDHLFNIKDYIIGMTGGGHNVLIWKDPAVKLSRHPSVKLTDFVGRLLPEQNLFSYDPLIANFNSALQSTLTLSQKDSPEALMIEGAVVECNSGTQKDLTGTGRLAGKAVCAVVCEIYKEGRAKPCIRIYMRESGPRSDDPAETLNRVMNSAAARLATALDTAFNPKPSPILTK